MDTYSNSILCKKKMYPGWMGSATLLTAEQTSGLTKQAEVLVKLLKTIQYIKQTEIKL